MKFEKRRSVLLPTYWYRRPGESPSWPWRKKGYCHIPKPRALGRLWKNCGVGPPLWCMYFFRQISAWRSYIRNEEKNGVAPAPATYSKSIGLLHWSPTLVTMISQGRSCPRWIITLGCWPLSWEPNKKMIRRITIKSSPRMNIRFLWPNMLGS